MFVTDSPEDENQLHTVTVESVMRSPADTSTSATTSTTSVHHTVRVVVTNEDSSSDSDDCNVRKPKGKLSTLFGKHSADQVIELEAGRGQRSHNGEKSEDSVTAVSESISLTKHRLRPKPPAPQPTTGPTAHRSSQSPTRVKSFQTGNDVILSIGDLELEDFDEPVKVHAGHKKMTDEHIV